MARDIRGGTLGTKAALFRLSQPRGAVTTTSSNVWIEPVVVRSNVLGFSSSVRDGMDSIEVTVVERWILPLARAVSATRSRIALYVLATKRFSEKCQVGRTAFHQK